MRTTSRFRWLTTLAASLVAVSLTGCSEPGPPTGTVKGKVTMDDSPYSGGVSVVFMDPNTGQAGSANIQSDGTFSIKTPLQVGSYNVFFGPKVSDKPDGTMEPGEESFDDSLPKKYCSESTTDIKIDIVEGPNDVAVPLTSK